MTTLKSALRFPTHQTSYSSTAIPTPPPIPPADPILRSRFSAETLVLKSPPGTRTIQRLFSSSTTSTSSPPSSPSGYRRSHSFSATVSPRRLKHSPSASESKINISSPRLYDDEQGEDPWSRTSLDEAEVLRSPAFVVEATRKRRASAGKKCVAVGGEAIDLGKDKLAGVTREVRDLWARRKGGGQHRGNDSGESGKSSARGSTTPTGSASSTSKPPRPTRQVPTPPRPSTESSCSFGEQHYKLIDLPPRSDSRTALVETTLPSSRPLLAPSASTAPYVTSSSTHTRLRPHAPPSISIPPLHPRPRPRDIDPVDRNPFKVLLSSVPSAPEIRSRGNDEILVEINAGGQLRTTTVETIIGERGGKIGEFVKSVVDDLRSQVIEPEPKVKSNRKEGHERPALLRIPSSTEDEEGDDSRSNISITPSHFDVSPHPSPFPFMRYSSSKSDLGDPCDLDAHDADNYCGSPIDPLAPQLFLPLPAFHPPPPPLRLDLDPHPSSRRVEVVQTPTVDNDGRSKHLSVHPTISSNPILPSVPRSPFVDSPVVPFTPVDKETLDAWTKQAKDRNVPVSPNELAARRALAKRLHLSMMGIELNEDDDKEEDEVSLGLDHALEPFFEVLRNQTYQSIPSSTLSRPFDDSPILPRSPFVEYSPIDGISPSTTKDKKDNVSQMKSLYHYYLPGELLPTDVGVSTPEEDRSRSTVLGIPRGSVKRSKRKVEKELKGERWDVKQAKLPKVVVEDDEGHLEREESRSADRPPSLTMSTTTLQTDSSSSSSSSSSEYSNTSRSTAPPTVRLFLDRTDTPLPSNIGGTVYSTILTFLRQGSLPPSLDLLASSSPIDPTTLSILSLQPSLALVHLAALRTIESEATWLSIEGLVKVCQAEREKWVEVVKLLEERNVGAVTAEIKAEGGEDKIKVMKRRELAGWI